MWKKFKIYFIQKVQFWSEKAVSSTQLCTKKCFFEIQVVGGSLFLALSVDFPDPIRHFPFSPIMGIIRMLFLSLFFLSCNFSYFLASSPPEEPVFVQYFKVCWEDLITMVILLIFINLNFFVLCVKFCLFTDYDQITFLLQTFQIQNFLTRTLSSSFL